MADPKATIVLTAVDKASAVLKGVGKQTNGLARSFGRLNTLLVGFASVRLGQGFVGILRQTEVLNASLKTATGSTEAAAEAFDNLQEFAAKTPFALSETVRAFVQLKNLGLDPSIEALTAYGNTAAATGRSLNQFIEAVADAATGEFERLKEFGIKAKSQGDQVALTFRGVTTTIGKNAREIEGYLRRIGEVEFAGAIEERANTLDGALSNLGDSFIGLANKIGEAGLTEILNDTARSMADVANAIPGVITALGGFATTGAANKTLEQINARIAVLKRDPSRNPSRQAQVLNEISFLENRRNRLIGLANEAEIARRDFEEQFGPFDDPEQIAAANFVPTRAKSKPAARVSISRSSADLEAQREANRLIREREELERQLADVVAEVDPVAPLLKQIDALERLKGEFPAYFDIITERQLQYQEQIDEITFGVEEQAEAVESLGNKWEVVGPVIADAFGDAIVKGGSLSDILKGLEQDLLRIASRQLITKPLGDALSGFLGGGGLASFGLPGFATGGGFTVGGSGGTDSQLVAFRATPGESVSIKTPAQHGGVVNNFSFVLPADTVDYRRTGQQVAREASRVMSVSRGLV